jgi:hypothetical protein
VIQEAAQEITITMAMRITMAKGEHETTEMRGEGRIPVISRVTQAFGRGRLEL